MNVTHRVLLRGNVKRLLCLFAGHDWFLQAYRKEGEFVTQTSTRCLRCQRIVRHWFELRKVLA